jgi:hypothetical protein
MPASRLKASRIRDIERKEIMKRMLMIIVSHLVLLSGTAYSEYIPVFDHFDDGTLDPAWSITLEEATGWSYTEAGTELTVTDIDPFGGGKVILSRAFSSLNDFYVDLDFSWGSEGSNSAYQLIYLTLYDNSHNIIAFGGYQDPWNDSPGQKVLVIGAESHETHGPSYQPPSDYYLSGADSLPLAGSASINISRVDDNLQLFWDNTLLVSGVDSTPLGEIEIEFMRYAINYFGTESVDQIRVADAPATPVPEPSTLDLPVNEYA